MNLLVGEIQRSQTDLQASERTFLKALSAFSNHTGNPSKREKCDSTVAALTKAIESAEDEQHSCWSERFNYLREFVHFTAAMN